MKYLVCLCLLFSLSLAAQTTGSAFLWSGKQYFSGQNLQLDETIYSNDIKDLLANILGGSKSEGAFSSILGGDIKPEVVVLYVVPELRTDMISTLASAYAQTPNGGSLSHLKEIMETSTSSVSVPYLFLRKPLTEGVIAELIKEVQGNVILARSKNSAIKLDAFSSLKGIDAQTIESLMSFLQQKDAPIYTNKQTDIIVVFFDEASWSTDDAVLGFIDETIKENTNSNYFAMYSSNTSPEQNFDLRFVPESFLPSLRSIQQTPSNATVQIFPKSVIEGIITAIVLITGILIGTFCLAALQAPAGLEGVKKKVK